MTRLHGHAAPVGVAQRVEHDGVAEPVGGDLHDGALGRQADRPDDPAQHGATRDPAGGVGQVHDVPADEGRRGARDRDPVVDGEVGHHRVVVGEEPRGSA
ncbi:hypothetical protein G5V59_08940 [Nocardioides sp. W3-2-3]|uniref:hypothetical protein n=1 Tax=Nocardioides convexus TaxID=2712224 RepID=UPI0024189AB0|nr:hypothetical protein [Nocardioides convexus]NHA00211.1 hypothetical protein [Nocardioides convexus]